MRYSWQSTTPNGTVMIAFDTDAERIVVGVEQTAGTLVVVAIPPRDAALMLRTLKHWPLDLLDTMAAADERARRARMLPSVTLVTGTLTSDEHSCKVVTDVSEASDGLASRGCKSKYGALNCSMAEGHSGSHGYGGVYWI